MADIFLFHRDGDGGEIEIIAGQPTLEQGLETATYLSLFGGNEDDSGLTDGDPKSWWANFEEPDAKRRYRSKVQHLLRSLPATSGNLRRVEDAARDDLAWMVNEINAAVEVEASIPALNRIELKGVITIGKSKYPFKFPADWSAVQ